MPTTLIDGPVPQSSLLLDGCSVIEQCIHSMEAEGTMYLQELYFLLYSKMGMFL
ncbi:hypothetical protein SAMN05421593_1494 [Chryseobacterium culicis]|uniref:Uncharacterized protein n=2 Tax=Chryseobacterium culicis TaxID=680127 RepID=A0A1H6HBW7_CHRCI|nr:hypothetical protein SAMN05421593_1494 [Chryseobacterium culicis]